MARGLPSNIIKKLYSKNIDSAFLTVLTIYADGEILRLVDNQVNITYKSNVYSSSHFTIVYPDDTPDSVPTASVIFADIGNTFLDLVRNYNEIYCDVEMIAVKTTGEVYLYQGMSDSTFITADSTLYTADMTLLGEGSSAGKLYGERTFHTVYETYVGPYKMRLSNASGDAGTTSFTISYDDIGQYKFPAKTFNPYDFPAIY